MSSAGQSFRPQGGSVKFLQNGAPFVANMQDIAKFSVIQWNSWEFLNQTLFDSAAYPAAGVPSIKFFQQPQGQGVGFGGGAKTFSDTNMDIPGMLASGKMFVITQVELQFQPSTPTPAAGANLPSTVGAAGVAAQVNDAFIFWRSGNLNLTILSKPYLQEGPLVEFPGQSDFSLQAGLSNATTPAAALASVVAYASSYGNPFSLSPNNLLIPETTNFSVNLSWPEGNQVITNPARVFVRLRGMAARLSQ